MLKWKVLQDTADEPANLSITFNGAEVVNKEIGLDNPATPIMFEGTVNLLSYISEPGLYNLTFKISVPTIIYGGAEQWMLRSFCITGLQDIEVGRVRF